MRRRVVYLAVFAAACASAARPTPVLTTPPPPIVAPAQPTVTVPVAVRVDGATFVTGPGDPWTWAMVDGFRDLEILLAGGDLAPQLQETRDLGANGRRVLLSAINLFQLDPRQQLHFLEGVAQLADLYAAHGLYGEFVVFADAQIWLPSVDEQRAHLARVREALGDRVNVFLSLANEPFKNGVDPRQFSAPRPGPLFAFGDAVDGMPLYGGGDFATFHTRRDWKWVVTVPQTVLELHQAFANPIVLNEPMGAAEVARSDRSTDPAAFYRYGVDAALHASGATFHSEAGLQSQLLGPVQRRCADAFFRGLTVGAQR